MDLPQTHPKHIAIIMDGNGRWAKKRFLPRTAGHKKALDRVRDIIEHCATLDIEVLTLFTFSSENWSRPADEVSTLMSLLLHSLENETKKLHQNNIQFQVIGDIATLNTKLQDTICYAKTLTKNNTGLKLRLAINYGGKWDIINAVKSVINELDGQIITSADISEDTIEKHLSTAELPPPDLFIRTGNEQRISNFLLWQLAYTELYFSDVLFPEFSVDIFNQALHWFTKRERRFGKTSEQLVAKDIHVKT